jgi:two-component system, sensor histidine kinase and response regulator
MLEEKYGAVLDEKGRRYLRFIADNALHMQKMILDTLGFAQIGREELSVESVDCNHILEAVLAKFEAIIEQKQARITHEFLPTLQTSPTLMHILFQNLIGNALKFQDGSIAPEINIRAEARDDLLQFCIQDNGIGIAPEYKEKVFAIFQRVHRREVYPGTGIGLSTCKKFIELCNGKIWFESNPGQGTSFFFTLHQEAKRTC